MGDAVLDSYSSSATLRICRGYEGDEPYWNGIWICLSGFENGLGIYVFTLTWLCLTVEILATWEKFLWPPGFCNVINCAFTFSTANVFWSLLQGFFLSLFKLLIYKFLNKLKIHINLRGFQIIHRVKQCTTRQRTKYHDTINYSG